MQRSLLLLLVIVLVITFVVAGFFLVRSDSPSGNSAELTPSATDRETGGVPATADGQAIVVERAAEAAGATLARTETGVLRVVLEGISEENARMTTVTLTGVDRRAFDPRLATPEQQQAYVKWIQTSLNRVLETQLTVDGRLGQMTHQAVIAFQRREGLPADGRIGPETESKLIRHVEAPLMAMQWPAELRASWSCQGLTSEFDLDPFFADVAGFADLAERDGDVHVDELEVHVDHPLHLIEWNRVPLSRGVEQNGRTVYEVRVRLVPAGVIHGRVTRRNGTPAAEGLVGAVLLEEGFPVEQSAGAVECAADGAFELRLGASGHYAVAFYEEGRRPTTTQVDVLVGTRIDVGTTVLESGHAITGQVLGQGNPVTGVSVSLTPPRWRTAATPEAIQSGMRQNVYEGRTFTTPARSVHLLWLTPNATHLSLLGPRRGGRFELSRQWVDADENGAFAFGELGPIEYLLRIGDLAEANASLGEAWAAARQEGMIHINGGKPALAVRAPEHGVVLEFRETLIRFELAGDLEGEDEGRLVVSTRSRHATPVDENGTDLRLVADPLAKNLNFMPEFLTGQFPLSGDEPTYVLQAPPNKHMTGEIAFPGRLPVPLDFTTPDPGEEIVIPVQLERAEELATLVIELETPPAEIPETFTILLWRAGLAAPPDTQQVKVHEGQLRLEGLLPGTYRVNVRPGVDRDYPTGLFFESQLDLELPPGQVVTRSIMLEQCAGLRLTVRNEDGALVGGEFDFVNDQGGRANLTMVVGEGQRRGYSYLEFYPYGTHESVSPLKPGRYRLVLVSPGYAQQSVMVELRAGEYTDVDVTLSQ